MRTHRDIACRYSACGAFIALQEHVKGATMKTSCMRVTFALCCCVMLGASQASAQQAANQTQGFGNGRLVLFTYLQNFDCVDEPTLDLDFNGKPAASDPAEMQMPNCQLLTEPT